MQEFRSDLTTSTLCHFARHSHPQFGIPDIPNVEPAQRFLSNKEKLSTYELLAAAFTLISSVRWGLNTTEFSINHSQLPDLLEACVKGVDAIGGVVKSNSYTEGADCQTREITQALGQISISMGGVVATLFDMPKNGSSASSLKKTLEAQKDLDQHLRAIFKSLKINVFSVETEETTSIQVNGLPRKLLERFSEHPHPELGYNSQPNVVSALSYLENATRITSDETLLHVALCLTNCGRYAIQTSEGNDSVVTVCIRDIAAQGLAAFENLPSNYMMEEEPKHPTLHAGNVSIALAGLTSDAFSHHLSNTSIQNREHALNSAVTLQKKFDKLIILAASSPDGMIA